MANAGMPIPNIPISEAERESAFGKFITAIASLFRNQSNNNIPMPTENPTSKTYSEEEYNALKQQLTEANALADSQKKTIAERDKTIADLEDKLAKTPAEPSKQVVEDSKQQGAAAPKNDVERFVDTYNSAKKLFGEV